MPLLKIIQARHQFFNWKLETRRGNPIRTSNPLKRDCKLSGGYKTDPDQGKINVIPRRACCGRLHQYCYRPSVSLRYFNCFKILCNIINQHFIIVKGITRKYDTFIFIKATNLFIKFRILYIKVDFPVSSKTKSANIFLEFCNQRHCFVLFTLVL